VTEATKPAVRSPEDKELAEEEGGISVRQVWGISMSVAPGVSQAPVDTLHMSIQTTPTCTSSMSARFQGLVLIAGIAGALLLLVWPVRAHHAMWAVTVGSEGTKTVPVGGGELVTPIQVKIEGTGPEDQQLRAQVERRVRAAAAAVAGSFVAFALLRAKDSRREKRPE